MSDITEIGKLKQALNNKVDRDYYNNNREAFNRETTEAEIVKRSQAHFSGENKSELGAASGWIHYDQENDILEVKRKDGEWREIGGATSELKGRVDVIRCKETTITDDSVPLVIELDETYPASKENLQVFIDGKIIESGNISVSDNGLTLTIDPKALVKDAQVKVQYFNYVPRSAIRAGISSLGQVCDTSVTSFLEEGAVYADGYVYEKNEDGTFKYLLENESDKSKWIETEDFSEELYSKLRFSNRNEIDETAHPEYETLLNDDRSNYIDAISIEHWKLEENKIYFALDPEKHRYIVPSINSDISSLKKYVVVKSIYNDMMAIGKSIISLDTTIRNNIQQLNTYLDSSSNRIVHNVSSTQYSKSGNKIRLLGPTKLFYPNGILGGIQQYSDSIISTNASAYLTLSVDSVDDGDYLVILNKIGNSTTGYTIRYIPNTQFYIADETTEKTTGAYLYENNSKIEVYKDGIKDDNYFSMPLCRVKVENHIIVDFGNYNNIIPIANGIIIYPQIRLNIPLGFGDNFSRRNSICDIDTPQFVKTTNLTKTIYAELQSDDNVIVKASDYDLIYDFKLNQCSLNSNVVKACEIVHFVDGNIFRPVYDKFYAQEKLYFDNLPIKGSTNVLTSDAIYSALVKKADIHLENTGFISNGIIEISEDGLGQPNLNTYSLSIGTEFLFADGLESNGRLKSLQYTNSESYELSLAQKVENGFIFFDYDKKELVLVPKYVKQESTPDTPVENMIWYNKNTNEIKQWNGTQWNTVKAIEIANHVNSDDSGNITSYQNVGILTSGEGKIYQAGNGVSISDDGVISVTKLEWGNIEGDINNQPDLQDSLHSIVVELKLISDLKDAEQIKNRYNLDLVTGDVIFCTSDNKFYKHSASGLVEIDDELKKRYFLDLNRVYLSQFSKTLYGWNGTELYSLSSQVRNELVEVKFSKGDQNITLPEPCKDASQIAIISVGQVVLDPTDYIFVDNVVTLNDPAEEDGYLRYLSSAYQLSDITNNYTKYTKYTVQEKSKVLRIPLGAACSNLDSIIASTNNIGMVPRDLMSLEDKGTTLVLTSSDYWNVDDELDVWFGIVFGQTIAQSDWEETNEQSSAFIRNKPEFAMSAKRVNLTGLVVSDDTFSCVAESIFTPRENSPYEFLITTEAASVPENAQVIIKIDTGIYKLNNLLQTDPTKSVTVAQIAQVKYAGSNAWLFEAKFINDGTNQYFLNAGTVINAETIIPKLDNSTIQTNSNRQLEAFALQTAKGPLKLSAPMTLAEYEKIETKDASTIYNIIDDYNSDDRADINFSNITKDAKKAISDIWTPSNKYTNLTIGASGTAYTAPGNGWFCLNGKDVTITSQKLIALVRNQTRYFGTSCESNTTNPENCSLILPAKYGDIVSLFLSNPDSTWFSWRFYYAESN